MLVSFTRVNHRVAVVPSFVGSPPVNVAVFTVGSRSPPPPPAVITTAFDATVQSRRPTEQP